MVYTYSLYAVAAAVALAGRGVAHPGEPHTANEIERGLAEQRHANFKMNRALHTCANNLSYIARKERAVARRAEKAKAIRQMRGIEHKPMLAKRDAKALRKWMAISHDQTDEGFDLDTPHDILFSGNATCALVTETTIGPYWVSGELVRQDITEGQKGVPLHLEVEYVDVNDCSAIPNMVIDAWQTNATGVYSGVSAYKQAGLETSFLRGAQITDEDGVAAFDTIFPGHYYGRTPHIHVLSTKHAKVLENNTYVGGTATHVGQLFFDQSLINAIEKNAPYKNNDEKLTPNEKDGILVAAATADYDVFVDYAMLGDRAQDGLLAWITVGVDMSADFDDTVVSAAHWLKEGGVDTTNDDGQPVGKPLEAPTGSDAPPTPTTTPREAPTQTAIEPSTTVSSGAGAAMKVPALFRWF